MGSGVQKVSQLRGDGLSAEAAYEVVLSSAGNTQLVYEVTEFDHEALTATLVATHSWFRSIDTISATGDDDGSDVTYDATLELRGPLALLDPSSSSSSTALATRPPPVSSGSSTEPQSHERKAARSGPRDADRSEFHPHRRGRPFSHRTLDRPRRLRPHRAHHPAHGRHIGPWPCRSPSPRRLGATLLVVGRNPAKTDAACAALPPDRSDPRPPVRRPRRSRRRRGARRHGDRLAHDLDTLIHNAGALSAERTENADGIESTVASQVLGPFLLTARLLPTLRSNGPARVLTMSSGGMYSAASPSTASR